MDTFQKSPNVLSLCTGYGESKKVLSECLEASPSSLTWRSKPSPLPTWLKRWKREKWLRRLSGRILRPSDRESFEDMLTSSLGDIRVSHFQQLENGKGKMTQGTYGHTSSESLKNVNPGGFFSRMSRDISASGSARSSKIWKTWVTGLRSEYSQRLKSAHHTREKGSLSWGTPRVTTNGGRPAPQCTGKGCRLEDQAAMWPTASSRDWKDTAVMKISSIDKSGKKRICRLDQLPRAVFNAGHPDQTNPSKIGKSRELSSPHVNCSTGAGSQEEGAPQGMNGEMVKGVFPPGAKLNPNWVEQLMGVRTGLTAFGSWEMG